MAIGQKYINITNFLQNCGKDQLKLTFDEVNEICTIPNGAYTKRTQWRNSGQSFSSSWMNAGYKASTVNVEEQWVEFVRSDEIQANGISADAANELLDSGLTCLDEILEDGHHQYRSWEHCYGAFRTPFDGSEERADYLALQLSWYLGSWGMIRNSFLQNKDYKIQIPIVKLLMDEKWDELRGLPSEKLADEKIAQHILDLAHEISLCYEKNAGGKPTDTLTTKLLLGTLGCVPAYDRYFKAALRKTGAASGTFGKRSLMQLGDFYQQYQDELEALRSMCPTDTVEYTQAKVLDMCFFGYGMQQTEKANVTE